MAQSYVYEELCIIHYNLFKIKYCFFLSFVVSLMSCSYFLSTCIIYISDWHLSSGGHYPVLGFLMGTTVDHSCLTCYLHQYPLWQGNITGEQFGEHCDTKAKLTPKWFTTQFLPQGDHMKKGPHARQQDRSHLSIVRLAEHRIKEGVGPL